MHNLYIPVIKVAGIHLNLMDSRHRASLFNPNIKKRPADCGTFTKSYLNFKLLGSEDLPAVLQDFFLRCRQ